ncbi:MAG TPA: glycosyltransferase family 39 protein [Gaiellaceae bacterium]|nr:glycosyltransferase family 39 protein [Gaiellaceae bacterium]
MVLAWTGVGGAVALLAVRLIHDVGTKPYSEDEAVAGLIAARPFGELLRTVVWDRGGSPLHFVLAHVVFEFSATPAALRWLSVVCALATVVCTYMLATELAGKTAGVAAAWIVAASSLLRVYGTFGRMYSLLAFVGSLNLLLFLRVLRQPSKRRVWLAVASAWLLAATHPFGLIPAGAEAVVGLSLWRGRGWTRPLPGLVAALAAVPLFAGEFRLAGRFDVSTSNGASLGGGGAAKEQLLSALRGFAGGNGTGFWLFVVLALIGAAIVARRSLGFTLVGASAILAAPILSLMVHVRNPATAFLSPRHLIVALPFWATLIAVAAVRLTRLASARADLAVLAVLAVATVAALAPASAPDPRTELDFWQATGAVQSSRVVGDYLAQRIAPGDVLYPYAVPFFAALPAARVARALPRGDPRTLVETLGNVTDAQTLWVTYAIGPGDRARPARLHILRRKYDVAVFRNWLVLRVRGPFTSKASLLAALGHAVNAAATTVATFDPDSQGYDAITIETATEAAADG